MTIGEIIDKRYKELYRMAKRKNVVVSKHQTSEDVFQNVMLMALNKWKDEDLDEDFGFKYLKKSLAMELKFQFNKIDNTEVSLDDEECHLDTYLYELDMNNLN